MSSDLWPYQSNGISKASAKIVAGVKRLLFFLPTGGGKTVIFSRMIARYLVRNPTKNALIMVHREELLKQARQILYHRENLIAEIVQAGVKYWPPGRVHVAMVETAFNRLKKKPDWFKNVGLVIVDECHLDNFSKTFPFFEDVITIGFTASAISATKSKPLKDFYDDIVIGAQIEELIALWHTDHTKGLVPNITFNAENINRDELRVSGAEFNEEVMSAIYSVSKHVENTVKAYEEHCIGEKTMIFNCNKQHSKLVTQAFVDKGYNARHLDSDAPDHLRTDMLKWFRETPDAIINNIGILTTGFDEPSIKWIIVNLATKSLSKWLQINGRGSRPYPGKEFFGTIDMGNNWVEHGEWSTPRDWDKIFRHPEEPVEGGIGGRKECPNCHALIPVSSKTCAFCEQLIVHTAEQVYDQANLQFRLVTKKMPIHINVSDIIEQNSARKSFYALHQIKHQLINHYRVETITDAIAYDLLSIYQTKVEEWCRLTKNDYNQFIKEKSGQWLLAELKTVYSWSPSVFTLKF